MSVLNIWPKEHVLGLSKLAWVLFFVSSSFFFFFWRAQKLINYQHYYKDNNSYSVYLNYSYCHHFLHNCHLWWCSSHVGFFSSFFFSKTNNNMLLILLKAIKIVISTATILSSSLPWLFDCLENVVVFIFLKKFKFFC